MYPELPTDPNADHCKGCGRLVWRKDMRKGRCIDCIVEYYEDKLKEKREQPKLI